MEKRIFAGLVKNDIMYGWLAAERIASPIEFIPSKHTSSWFAINDLNNYLENSKEVKKTFIILDHVRRYMQPGMS